MRIIYHEQHESQTQTIAGGFRAWRWRSKDDDILIVLYLFFSSGAGAEVAWPAKLNKRRTFLE